MDKRLTIILALKGRHKFTERWLNFANKHLRVFKILIADGSEKNDYYHFDKTKFNLNVEYRTFPTDKDISYFVKKLQNCSQEVNSKYILYANNDDLLFENEIINILDFLDNNNSHVAARGEIYDFSLSSFNEVYGKKS